MPAPVSQTGRAGSVTLASHPAGRGTGRGPGASRKRSGVKALGIVLSLFLVEAESLVGASLVASECAPRGVGFETSGFRCMVT